MNLSLLDKFISERKIVRWEWGDGMTCGCLAVAICPEVATTRNIFGKKIDSRILGALIWLDDCAIYAYDDDMWWEMVLRVQKLLHRGLPSVGIGLLSPKQYLDTWEKELDAKGL